MKIGSYCRLRLPWAECGDSGGGAKGTFPLSDGLCDSSKDGAVGRISTDAS